MNSDKINIQDRDRFLTEAMGDCWHEPEAKTYRVASGEYEYYICANCKKDYRDCGFQIDFSTWTGFGKLWEWATQQSWWLLYLESNHTISSIPTNHIGSSYLSGEMIYVDFIHPDNFANALYAFLKERE